MPSPRAWSLIAVGANQQYAGNRGYEDDPTRVYRYDSNVANSRQLARGDLVVIRDREHLTGIARIAEIREAPGRKTLLRCPACQTVDLKARKTMRPLYRCDKGHEFDEPLEDAIDVVSFEAHYGQSFVQTPDAVPVSMVKAAALRPSDQLSIEEIAVDRLEAAIERAYPASREILADFFQRQSVEAVDADESDKALGSTEPDDKDRPFTGSVSDSRRFVLRAIRQRRGQQKFREALFRRYGSVCMVTGCNLLDVVEAAHIWPYRGDEDNDPTNGLLLRADIHTLFDLNLLAVHPHRLDIALAPPVAAVGAYANLAGVRLRLSDGRLPARTALDRRWLVFGQLWGVPESPRQAGPT